MVRTFGPMLFFAKFDSWQSRAGLTDADVGEIASCAHSTIGRVKRGEIFLKPEKRQLICDASGGELRPADFAEFEEEIVRARRSSSEAAA